MKIGDQESNSVNGLRRLLMMTLKPVRPLIAQMVPKLPKSSQLLQASPSHRMSPPKSHFSNRSSMDERTSAPDGGRTLPQGKQATHRFT